MNDTTIIVLAIYTLAVVELYRIVKSGDEVAQHYGHYPTSHLLIGIAAAAPIAFMLGMWMQGSMGCDI